ncbi:SIR2 family protein [Flavobacterium sasangense]|uniref:SIR2 family protein n=1 Tax=Flavobacterium sasangense TaxID=503361 RepID=UPI000478ADDA|nr:SIR2 family protein [Flavobacterium sasangense]
MKLENIIKNNKLILFAGSGLSRNFGLPDWNKMVIETIKLIDKPNLNPFIELLKNGDTMSAIDVLEFLKNDEKEIRSYIKENFAIDLNQDFSLHKKLLELTNNKVITTNYDNAFELASNSKILPTNPTSKYNINQVNKDDKPFILKLHGSYTEPDNCVVFRDDYEKLYFEENDQAAPEKLKFLFSEYTFLFMGFSFSDPDINMIFSKLDKVFGGFNKHFIITSEPEKFKDYKFLEPIKIDNYYETNFIIDDLLKLKNDVLTDLPVNLQIDETVEKKSILKKIAFLSPNPIDIDLNSEIKNVINHVNGINAEFLMGTLNKKTLHQIEDYDLLIIVSKVYKEKIYVEDDNLKSNLLSIEEICDNIPNYDIPILLITNEKINIDINYSIINISCFKNEILKRFLFKIKSKKFEFDDLNIKSNKLIWKDIELEKGIPTKCSIYGNNRDLDIGKKCLDEVIGRVEEQINITNRLISIKSTNRILNIKASGGLGKTTLIKKIAYELYNRGYYKQGVNFKSCESIKAYDDFEELLIDGFNLTNIIDFKEYLIQNYSNNKIDLLIILDNFETVVNNLTELDFDKVVDILKFSSDYANISITSREKICNDNFEDVFTLTPMITDDAIVLFQKFYPKKIIEKEELKILRNDILEELLDRNPLAIKLVTTSRTPYKHISELRDQIKEHFFECINEEYTDVFKNSADLNIERAKSIFQSINYSYSGLTPKEKIAFELLNLFPDGISLNNFKKCFEKTKSSNNISDTELRRLENKSLIENYNGTLQLQPIIRRFAEYQFQKRKEYKNKYCLDAFNFNSYLFTIIEVILIKKSESEALKSFSHYKNNFIKVLDYASDIEINKNDLVNKKQKLLKYIYNISGYINNVKQINEFRTKTLKLIDFFVEINDAEKIINSINLRKSFYHQEFDKSYKEMSNLFSVDEMEKNYLQNKTPNEFNWQRVISSIHSMEGFTLSYIKSLIKNDLYKYNLSCDFYYLGIPDAQLSNDMFYYFESKLRSNNLEIYELEKYIDSLFMEEHLQIMQCTYTLSKLKKTTFKSIRKLVVTNPYTKGLKELMFAFNCDINEEKKKHFEEALDNLFHIKYFYLEALYYYCLYLKEVQSDDCQSKIAEGLELSRKFKYQYLDYLFTNIDNLDKSGYNFNYDYFEIEGLEKFVDKNIEEWGKRTID